MILAECKKRNIPCYLINTSYWWSKNDLEKNVTISNIDEDKGLKYLIYKTICFTRAVIR